MYRKNASFQWEREIDFSLTGKYNFHSEKDLLYSCRISNVAGLGHSSCFVVVCNVEQNCDSQVLCSMLKNNWACAKQKGTSALITYLTQLTMKRKARKEFGRRIVRCQNKQKSRINFFRVMQLVFFRDRLILSFENEENTDAQLVSYTCGSIDIRTGLPLRLLIIRRRVATREKTISFAIWCARGRTLHLIFSLYNRQYPYVSPGTKTY